MKKKIFAIISCIILLASICFIPDVDAGTPTLNLSNATYYIETGKSFAIKLNGIKANKVKWSSSNKSVATVSKKGVVKGIKKGTATITGKYNKLKFQVVVTVAAKNSGKYKLKDLEVEYKGTQYVTYNEEYCWAITFKFTNKSSSPVSFSDYFESEVYINNIEEGYYEDNEKVNIKNGASLDVTFFIPVKSGDKLEYKLKTYDENFNVTIVYKTTETAK